MDKLQIYRQKIDSIDEKMVNLLGKRFSIVTKIGEYKKRNNLPIIDKRREREKIKNLSELAQKYNLSKSLIKDIFNLFFKQAYKTEKAYE